MQIKETHRRGELIRKKFKRFINILDFSTLFPRSTSISLENYFYFVRVSKFYFARISNKS